MPLSEGDVRQIFRSQAELFALPGLAWLVKVGSEPAIIGACGVRRRHIEKDPVEEEAITGDEVFHWGSCSKALSATLVLILIEDPNVQLGWNTQLGQALPDLALPKAMAEVTVWQLLTHRSGLPADLDDDEGGAEEEAALAEATKQMSARDARLAYVRVIAAKPMLHAPGERYGPYSNAGYTVLGAMAEAVTGEAWEDMVLARIGKPLGMTSLGFGFPPGIAGHDEEGVARAPTVDDVKWHAPAYTCHATLRDWESFAMLHAAALRGEEEEAAGVMGLRRGALATLHRQTSPARPGETFDGAEGPEGYAMGWKTEWTARAGEGGGEGEGVLWHYGTNFSFNSAQFLGAHAAGGRGMLVLAASNSGSMTARLAMREAIDALLERA